MHLKESNRLNSICTFFRQIANPMPFTDYHRLHSFSDLPLEQVWWSYWKVYVKYNSNSNTATTTAIYVDHTTFFVIWFESISMLCRWQGFQKNFNVQFWLRLPRFYALNKDFLTNVTLIEISLKPLFQVIFLKSLSSA